MAMPKTGRVILGGGIIAELPAVCQTLSLASITVSWSSDWKSSPRWVARDDPHIPVENDSNDAAASLGEQMPAEMLAQKNEHRGYEQRLGKHNEDTDRAKSSFRGHFAIPRWNAAITQRGNDSANWSMADRTSPSLDRKTNGLRRRAGPTHGCNQHVAATERPAHSWSHPNNAILDRHPRSHVGVLSRSPRTAASTD